MSGLEPSPAGPLIELLIGLLVVGGAALMLTSAVAMLRAGDALTRINVFSPATGCGLPMIVTGAYLHQVVGGGFGVVGLVKYVVTVAALLVVSSVATNLLARAAYQAGMQIDPRTDPQDLARNPEPGAT